MNYAERVEGIDEMKKIKIKLNLKPRMNKLKNAVSNFREAPLKYAAAIVPGVLIAAAVVVWIAAFVLFLHNGGYFAQLNLIQGGGTSFEDTFSDGTVHSFYSKPFSIISTLLLITQIVLILISYFKSATKGKKIAMITALILTGILPLGILIITVAPFLLANSQMAALLSSDPSSLPPIVPAGFGIMITAAIVAVVLVLQSDSKEMFKDGFFAAIVTLAVLPLLLLIVENIISLGITALLIGIVWVILAVITSPDPKDEKVSITDAQTGKVKYEYYR